MNRAFQGRQLNFSSYKQRLDETIEDINGIATADAVSHWLRHRVHGSTWLAGVYALNDRLRKRIPGLIEVGAFDVFDPSKMPNPPIPTYGKGRIGVLFHTFLEKRFEAELTLPVLEAQWMNWVGHFPT
jgi:hypothetical protein